MGQKNFRKKFLSLKILFFEAELGAKMGKKNAKIKKEMKLGQKISENKKNIKNRQKILRNKQPKFGEKNRKCKHKMQFLRQKKFNSKENQ